jgi:hypothetical protein
MSRELLQQALNALRISAPLGHAMENYEYRHKVIKDIEAELAKPETPEDLLRQSEREGWRYAKELEQELAKPEQEPVAWHHPDCAGVCLACLIELKVHEEYGQQGLDYLRKRVQTSRKEWVGLTDLDIHVLKMNHDNVKVVHTDHAKDLSVLGQDVDVGGLINAIETILKERNGAL